MTPRLSILICHLSHRHKELARLTELLTRQIERHPLAAEVLINEDDGRRTTGEKRQELLNLATGDYVAAIDDDDLVSEDYIARILAALGSGPDVIGMEGIMTRSGEHPQKFVHSLKFDRWFDEGTFPQKTYFRCPNHLNPVRRELALAAGFPAVTVGEDRIYSELLRPMLKSEVMLEGPVYFYLAR